MLNEYFIIASEYKVIQINQNMNSGPIFCKTKRELSHTDILNPIRIKKLGSQSYYTLEAYQSL